MFHDSSLLEICDLLKISARVQCSPKFSPVIFHPAQNRVPSILTHTSRIVRTQLLAHALSNSLSSGAQAFLAFSSSRTLSMMLWRSRHLKKLSRPSQHCARALRSGAMKPPSCEGAGGGGVGCEGEELNQPMMDWFEGCLLVGFLGVLFCK